MDAVAVDEIEDTGRYSGIVHHLRPQNCAERRIFGRLQHHGASSGEGGDDFGRHLIHRPIPRRDEGADTDRFVDEPRGSVHFLELEGFQDLDHRADVSHPDAGL